MTQSIYQKTGITIQIIPGWKEAELIYHGVNSALTIGQKPALIMDIGGGSVEFIIGTDTQILWKQSYEIGAQRLVSLFHTNDPITPNEIKALNQYLKDQLHDLIHVLNNYQVKTLIGSSGTFDTLSEIYCAREKLDSDENQSEISFDKAAFSSIYQSILTKNRAQRLRIPGMVAMRVDMIVVACALIDFLLKQHKFNRVRVTTYALKEGILDRLIHNQL